MHTSIRTYMYNILSIVFAVCCLLLCSAPHNAVSCRTLGILCGACGFTRLVSSDTRWLCARTFRAMGASRERCSEARNGAYAEDHSFAVPAAVCSRSFCRQSSFSTPNWYTDAGLTLANNLNENCNL